MGDLWALSTPKTRGQRQATAAQRLISASDIFQAVRPANPSNVERIPLPLGLRPQLTDGDTLRGEASNWGWAGCAVCAAPLLTPGVFQNLRPPELLLKLWLCQSFSPASPSNSPTAEWAQRGKLLGPNKVQIHSCPPSLCDPVFISHLSEPHTYLSWEKATLSSPLPPSLLIRGDWSRVETKERARTAEVGDPQGAVLPCLGGPVFGRVPLPLPLRNPRGLYLEISKS